MASKTIQIRPRQSRYRVVLAFVPQKVGKQVYTISAPVQPGEALAANNSRSFVIKVIRDRIRVLRRVVFRKDARWVEVAAPLTEPPRDF